MATVQWRPDLNALTTPQSYWPRVMPKGTYGYAGVAERIARKYPLWSADLAESVLRAGDEEIMEIISQVALEDAFTCHLSITARLAAPDDPLPQDKDIRQCPGLCLLALCRGRAAGGAAGKAAACAEGAGDRCGRGTVLKLNDVLNPLSVLRLTGTDLFFELGGSGAACLKAPAAAGTVQSRFALISNTEILVVPEIPAQTDPWNNAYRVADILDVRAGT